MKMHQGFLENVCVFPVIIHLGWHRHVTLRLEYD